LAVFAESGPRDLVILHINDTHGYLFAPPADEDDSSGDKDKAVPSDEGGAARLATLVRRIREENPDKVLFVHAGDDLSSDEPITIYHGGEATVQVMNALGLDAMTPGNGEFYGGLDRVLPLRAKAQYVMLAANLAYRESGGEVFQPWTVREVNGVRIGILGLGFIRTEHPASQPLSLGDPVDTAKAYIPLLRSKADLVLLLTHVGEGEDMRIAAEVPGVDIIIGGHTHTCMDPPRRVKGPDGREVVVAQAGEFYRFLGRLDVAVATGQDDASRAEVQGRLIPVDRSVPEDAETSALLQGYLGPLEEVICVADEDINYARAGDSPIAQWAGAAIQRVAATDVVLLSRSDVCNGLTAGPVTLADLVRLNPWRNRIVIAELTAAEIEGLLASGKLMGVGCRLDKEGGKSAGLSIGNEKCGPDQRLRVAVTDYLHATTPELKDAPATVSDLRVDLILQEHAKQTKHLSAPKP